MGTATHNGQTPYELKAALGGWKRAMDRLALKFCKARQAERQEAEGGETPGLASRSPNRIKPRHLAGSAGYVVQLRPQSTGLANP